MENKKDFSILKVFVIVICVLTILVSVIVNVAFSNGKIPHILGKYIYIVDKKDNMGDLVTEGAAIIAKDAKNQTIRKGQIVLCYPADDAGNLRIREIITADTINNKYTTKDASHIDKGGADGSGTITKDDILALCSDCTESKELGSFIRFTTSIKGILLLLILPCVILVIFLISKIAATSSDDDEDFDFYEYDEKAAGQQPVRSHVKSGNPLFEASQEIQPSDELERKKMSIAENFSQKKINPESTAQLERERTMQFKSQRSAETSFAARNVGGSSSTAPTADALREEMLRKTAEAERTGQFSVRTAVSEDAAKAPIDNTGVLSKAQLAEMSRNDIPRTTPLRSQSAAPTAPRKSSSPDITDILRKTDTSVTKKKSVSDMSVDDLLRIIENEKKKL
ncbi:MAG: hypothetical protein IKO47_07205 [Ruminococcus sp.]|nr:hypothetical protein [Ruminococcus sp.]